MEAGHSLLWLALITFIAVLAFIAWSFISTRRRQMHGPDVEGLGNRDDPMVGSAEVSKVENSAYLQGKAGRPAAKRAAMNW